MRMMTPRWLATTVVLLVAVAAPAAVSARSRGVPGRSADTASHAIYTKKAIVCRADTRHFRVWWDDRVRSRDAPAGADGRCATVPPLAARTLAIVERYRTAELGYGFPAPSSDKGMARNGGDARHDVYIHRSTGRGEVGSEWCFYVTSGSRIVRSFSYTVIVPRLPAAGSIEETFAHEYFHAIQCRITPQLQRLPTWIAEGTANWMAALTVPAAFHASSTLLGNLMSRLVQSASGGVPLTAQSYDAWGFWYSATHAGTDAAVVKALLGRFRTGGSALAKVAASVPDLGAAVRDYALDARLGASLGGTPLPGALAPFYTTVPTLDLAAATSADGGTESVAPLGYVYRRLTWPAGSGTVTVHLAGAQALAGSVGLAIDAGPRVTTPAVVGDGLDLSFTTDGSAGSGLVVIASGRTTSTTVQITATRG